MTVKRILIASLAVLLLSGAAFAQARPTVAILTNAGAVYKAADMKAEAATYQAATPLTIVSAQDKKITVDGIPTLMYQVKDESGTVSWVPGSRLSFTSKGFPRAAFANAEQYLSYLKMAARPGDRFVAVRTYQKVKKGDMGWLAEFSGSSLPACIVWERNLDATPNEDYLPKGFPKELQTFVYFVNAADVELVLDAKPSALADLAKTLPKAAAKYDGFYSDATDDAVPWYYECPTSDSSDYGYDDSGYYDSDYYDDSSDYSEYDCDEGSETYGMFKVGSSVVLGKHDDINGGANWAKEMDKFVGTTTTITEFVGADSQGFIVAKVRGTPGSGASGT
jgi:hypothetical protein